MFGIGRFHVNDDNMTLPNSAVYLDRIIQMLFVELFHSKRNQFDLTFGVSALVQMFNHICLNDFSLKSSIPKLGQRNRNLILDTAGCLQVKDVNWSKIFH